MEEIFTSKGKPLTLIVLAGGFSRRMQRNKALLPVPGGILIEKTLDSLQRHFKQVIISVSDSRPFRFLSNIEIVEDPVSGQGPMFGIYTSLGVSKHEKNFVIACDIPVIPMDFLKKLIATSASYDITVPVTSKGRLQPLFAVYSRKIRPVMEELLAKGERSLLPLFECCSTRRVMLPEGRRILNLNTQKDYEKFLKSITS